MDLAEEVANPGSMWPQSRTTIGACTGEESQISGEAMPGMSPKLSIISDEKDGAQLHSLLKACPAWLVRLCFPWDISQKCIATYAAPAECALLMKSRSALAGWAHTSGDLKRRML